MYCDFEEYVKNRKPDKLSLKNLVNPSLEKPYDKDELALLSHLAVIYSESITLASEDENPEAMMTEAAITAMTMTTTMMTFRIF